jgi:hypothetical protein
MSQSAERHSARNASVGAFAIELAVYAVLVTGYFLLVLHFLGGALRNLYETNKTTYAIVTLALIVGQGVLLETVTTALLRVLQRWFTRH